MWNDEYGEIEDKEKDIYKNAKPIDSKILDEKRYIQVNIGICSSCRNCSIYERELGDITYKCMYHEKKLNLSRAKIIRCTEYIERNRLSLQEMASMAWTIDNNKKTIKGFSK